MSKYNFKEVFEEYTTEVNTLPTDAPTRGIYSAPPAMRIKDICDRVLVGDNCNESELNYYDNGELTALYANTDFLVENVFAEDEEKKKEIYEKKEMIYDVAKNRLKSESFYVVFCKKTETPFPINPGVALIYGQDFRAKEACDYLNFSKKKQGWYYLVEYNENTKAMMNKMFRILGIHSFSVDGSKLFVKLNDVVGEPTEEEKELSVNASLTEKMEFFNNNFEVLSPEAMKNLSMTIVDALVQHGRSLFVPVSKGKDEKSGKEFFRVQTLKHPKDGTNWIAIFTDEFAWENFEIHDNWELERNSFASVYGTTVARNKELKGIMVNPGKRFMAIPRENVEFMANAKAEYDVKTADKFHVLYSTQFDGKYPAINVKGQAFVFTDYEMAKKNVEAAPLMRLKIKTFTADKFKEELLSWYAIGVTKFIINGREKTRDEYLGEDALPVKDFGYSGSGLMNNMIRYGQMVGIEEKDYKAMAMTYWNFICHAISDVLYITPTFFVGEEQGVKVDDKELHFSKSARELYNKKKEEGKQEVVFYGANEYSIAENDEERALYFRTVTNGKEQVLPLFTDMKTLHHMFGNKCRIAVVTFDEMAQMALKYEDKFAGLVVNPTGVSFSLPKQAIESIMIERENPVRMFVKNMPDGAGIDLSAKEEDKKE